MQYLLQILRSTSAWLLSPWSVLLRNKMAERFASVSEDELCDKCIIKQLLNTYSYWWVHSLNIRFFYQDLPVVRKDKKRTPVSHPMTYFLSPDKTSCSTDTWMDLRTRRYFLSFIVAQFHAWNEILQRICRSIPMLNHFGSRLMLWSMLFHFLSPHPNLLTQFRARRKCCPIARG